MNVLQRRMFANGGPANQPLQSYQQLIASYAQKGLSVDEALVELGDPTFPRAEVEKIYAGLGYSIDPSVTDYQIIPQNPAGVVLGQPDLDFTVDLTDVETAPENLQLDFDTPEVNPIVEPVIENTTVPTGVGPNQIQLSDDRIIDVDIDRFKNNISGDNYQDIDIFGMLNNPNARLGTNVKAILENELSGRKSSLGYDRFIGGIGDLGADFTLTGRIIGDVLTQGAEGLVDKGLAALDFIRTNPALRGILSRREAVEQKRRLDAGEIPPRVPFEFYESPVIDDKGGPDFLSAVARGFATTDKLDDLYEDFASLENSAQSKTILKTEDGTTLDLSPELPDLEELEEITETDVQEDQLDQVEGQETKQDEQLPDEDVKKIPEVTYTFDANLAKEIAETPSLFQTDAFRRFIRNVGTGLVKTGQIGSGLAAGSVLAAEEEKAIEDTKREALLEAIKEGDKGPDYKEAKSDVDVNTEISKNANLYNNTYNAILDLNYTIDQVKKNPDAVTGPRGAIRRLYDQAAGAVGGKTRFEELSPASKVDLITRLLSNEQVKEILGESGRTISNVDREIVAQIFGTPGLLTTAGALETALVRSRERLIEKLGNYKNSITSNLDYFTQLNKTSALLQDSNNRDVFTKILTTDISNLRSIIRSPGQTDQYLQTNPLAIDLYPTT
jgi:hypothetical protein